MILFANRDGGWVCKPNCKSLTSGVIFLPCYSSAKPCPTASPQPASTTGVFLGPTVDPCQHTQQGNLFLPTYVHTDPPSPRCFFGTQSMHKPPPPLDSSTDDLFVGV